MPIDARPNPTKPFRCLSQGLKHLGLEKIQLAAKEKELGMNQSPFIVYPKLDMQRLQ
jgi:hypothetical protein